MVTSHVGVVPAQPPVQLTKCRPAAGVAVNVTVAPWVNLTEQVLPQSMADPALPASVPVTVPDPPRPIDKVNCGAKVAVVVICSLMVTAQVRLVPVQAPVQPVKALPEAGLALRVTTALSGTVAAQTLPQLSLGLALLTLPLPTLVMVIEGTPTLAAAICAPMKSPTSPSAGTAQMPSPQTT